MSGGGKGNSSQSTQQTASNQQVGASEGSAAIGANSSGNTVNITTADAAGLEELLASNTMVTQGAIAGNTGLAGLAIESQANLAGRSIDAINASNAANDQIVSSATEQALQATNGTLSQTDNIAAGLASLFTSFESANSPGSAALAVQQSGSKTQYNIVLLGGLALIVFYLMSKKP